MIDATDEERAAAAAAADGEEIVIAGRPTIKGAIRNPLNPLQLYVRENDDTILVQMGSRWGRFTHAGRHVEGPLFEADPELCVWIGAPRPTSHHRISRVDRTD